MIPSYSYSVSVTMRNNGTTTWTKATSHRLGAASGSDPFGPGRMDLGDTDSIAPGQSKAFSFTMTAPSASGIYTTDWRMLQENVQWFGPSVYEQANVTFGPGPPGAPTITEPAPLSCLGANQPDIRLSANPFDAYEVHIGSDDTPNSSNAWDSGVVSISQVAEHLKVTSGLLGPQLTYYVFARVHNPNGWGPWSEVRHGFYVGGEFLACGASPRALRLFSTAVRATSATTRSYTIP